MNSHRLQTPAKAPLLQASFAFMLALVAAPTKANDAIVTDVLGAVTFERSGKSGPLNLLDSLKLGDQLVVSHAGQLVLNVPSRSEEVSITGPARLRLENNELVSIAGGKPTVRKLKPLLAPNVRLQKVGTAQASLSMRSTGQRIKLLGPVNTRVTTPNPYITFEAGADARACLLTITDNATPTKPVLSEKLASAAPYWVPNNTLSHGHEYRWNVDCENRDGSFDRGNAQFAVIDLDAKVAIEKAKPAVNATLSERVRYGFLLEEVELNDEARTFWRQLASERPNDTVLKQRAGG